ncbi:hypothetical protein OIU84_005868 [Salix udensis]|uniref:Uncharacterized protein n=1 Tax=Salix udensis TaxID=889485 RepID=A0AAD6P1S1_9ROSI|nr:hypothetical protein OIU84_005868 [Salix udensis]
MCVVSSVCLCVQLQSMLVCAVARFATAMYNNTSMLTWTNLFLSCCIGFFLHYLSGVKYCIGLLGEIASWNLNSLFGLVYFCHNSERHFVIVPHGYRLMRQLKKI